MLSRLWTIESSNDASSRSRGCLSKQDFRSFASRRLWKVETFDTSIKNERRTSRYLAVFGAGASRCASQDKTNTRRGRGRPYRRRRRGRSLRSVHGRESAVLGTKSDRRGAPRRSASSSGASTRRSSHTTHTHTHTPAHPRLEMTTTTTATTTTTTTTTTTRADFLHTSRGQRERESGASFHL